MKTIAIYFEIFSIFRFLNFLIFQFFDDFRKKEKKIISQKRNWFLHFTTRFAKSNWIELFVHSVKNVQQLKWVTCKIDMIYMDMASAMPYKPYAVSKIQSASIWLHCQLSINDHFSYNKWRLFYNKWLIKCIDSTVLCGILEQSQANSLNISNQTWNYIIFSFNLRSLVTVVLIDFRTYFTQFSNLLERSFYSNKIAEC